jgi:hypothetical protein
MNIHEYQAKQLLKQCGVTVPPVNRALPWNKPRYRREDLWRRTQRGRGENVRSTPAAAAKAPSKADFKAASNWPARLMKSVPTPRTCSAMSWSPNKPGRKGAWSQTLLVATAETIKKEFYPGGLAGIAVNSRRSSWPVPKAGWTSKSGRQNPGENPQGMG